MEKSKLFRTIGRINSVLFLLLLIGAAIMFIVIAFQAGGRRTARTVAVTGRQGDDETKRIEMVLGSLEEIHGHDAHYVELSTQWKGGKFSSGYSGGQTRNILFFVGPELDSHWLYEDHSNLIYTVVMLNRDTKDRKGKITEALFFRVIKEDTDGDRELTVKDLSTIALTKPDGTSYKEIETDVQSLIDKEVSDNGRSLMLLLQSDHKVYLKKYSLSDFSKVTEKVLTEIRKE
jgi:hypothetical protein